MANGNNKEKIRLDKYNEGYRAAEADMTDENIKHYTDGFKAGYKEGYEAAMKDARKMMITQMPPELREKMIEDGLQQWGPLW